MENDDAVKALARMKYKLDPEFPLKEAKIKLATQQALDKKLRIEKGQGKQFNNNFILSDSTPVEDISGGNDFLDQSAYEKFGFGNKVRLKDTFKILFDGNGYKNETNKFKRIHGVPDASFNIGATLDKFSMWFLFYFSIFSESIIVVSMIFYSLFTFFYKMKNKNNDMKTGSKLLLLIFIFNLLILPILLTFFFNTKYGLLR
jgi:hypothetical protein